ncbi:MAG: hypothetical protein ACREFP_20220 [Acetobacteraceae bacterium]
MVLGDLIAKLDRPDVCAGVLATLDAEIARQVERRAQAVSMTAPDFAAGAVREFMERASDELWFELLTIIRKAEDPGIAAVQTILRWVVVEQEVRSNG